MGCMELGAGGAWEQPAAHPCRMGLSPGAACSRCRKNCTAAATPASLGGALGVACLRSCRPAARS